MFMMNMILSCVTKLSIDVLLPILKICSLYIRIPNKIHQQKSGQMHTQPSKTYYRTNYIVLELKVKVDLDQI